MELENTELQSTHKVSIMCLPLLASLEVLLSNHKILDMVAEPYVSEPHSSLLNDFADGIVVQQHELFSLDHQFKNNLIL